MSAERFPGVDMDKSFQDDPGNFHRALDMLQDELTAGATGIRSRPCLVCETPCRTEGQLCRSCAADGCRVTDTEVIVAIDIEIPDSLR